MDVTRLLCDIQHNDSTTRKHFILSSLKKDMKEHLTSTKIDSFLFSAAVSTSHDSPPILNAVKYAGRLSLFYRRWSQITDDHTILSWIKGYKIKFSSPVSQDTVPVPRVYTDSERIQLIEAIDNLLQIGAVSECKPCCGQYLSSFFLTPKSNGKMRFILNLKN